MQQRAQRKQCRAAEDTKEGRIPTPTPTCSRTHMHTRTYPHPDQDAHTHRCAHACAPMPRALPTRSSGPPTRFSCSSGSMLALYASITSCRIIASAVRALILAMVSVDASRKRGGRWALMLAMASAEASRAGGWQGGGGMSWAQY